MSTRRDGARIRDWRSGQTGRYYSHDGLTVPTVYLDHGSVVAYNQLDPASWTWADMDPHDTMTGLELTFSHTDITTIGLYRRLDIGEPNPAWCTCRNPAEHALDCPRNPVHIARIAVCFWCHYETSAPLVWLLPNHREPAYGLVVCPDCSGRMAQEPLPGIDSGEISTD